ncbi:hypothetical protein C8F04DRAFT_1197749 [Mycena alexandri]|uniref:Uncharacterized protein n=1 Tax=Mycena alexandri TaxID=1745969 RepID=A0AAD6S1A8_9AGAR|nr:hypothetical protein C8F04DRAFT_1197749 [Mycena alexandri]
MSKAGMTICAELGLLFCIYLFVQICMIMNKAGHQNPENLNNYLMQHIRILRCAPSVSRTEHDALTGDKLVRKRTQARLRSDREGGTGSAFSAEPETFANPHPEIPDPYAAGPAPGGRQQQQQGQGPPSAYRGAYGQPQPQQDPAQRRTRVMELARKSSLVDGSNYRQASAGGFDYRAGGGGGGPPPGAGYASPAPGQGGGNPYAQNGGYGGAGAGAGAVPASGDMRAEGSAQRDTDPRRGGDALTTSMATPMRSASRLCTVAYD